MIESFDKGNSWSTPIKVNDDETMAIQDLVWGETNERGDLIIIWRDRRHGNQSNYISDYGIMGAVRFKDSSYFTQNFAISSQIIPFDSVLLLKGNDFLCCKFYGDTIYSVWGDSRTVKLNIWFNKININTTYYFSKNLEEDIYLKIYPIPSKDILYIESKEKIYSIEIFDNKCEKIKYKSIKGNDKIKIETSNLLPGYYLIRIKTCNQNIYCTNLIIK